jgi:hypothetical protein
LGQAEFRLRPTGLLKLKPAGPSRVFNWIAVVLMPDKLCRQVRIEAPDLQDLDQTNLPGEEFYYKEAGTVLL